MKKTLLLSTLFFTSLFYAQETSNTDYNKWSVELSGGMHKPARPLTSGYYTDTPSFSQFEIGTRYMFNDKAGARIDFGYQMMQEGDGSLAFETNFWRISLQGVANLGNVLGFHTWTNSLGLLAHAGAGYGKILPQEPFELNNGDQVGYLIAGITPQLRLGNRVALKGDLSMIGNFRQDVTWDGASKTNMRGFNGYLVNVSLGINVYLGKNQEHADWVRVLSIEDDKFSELENRIAKIETDLIDSDQDGIPDYLDREPNTPSGVAVDSKGRAIDRNENGIPDEMERHLDQRYARADQISKSGDADQLIKTLLNEGYVNVYFKFDSAVPEIYSFESINYLVRYMNDNPSASADLIGYADEIGNAEYNRQLSERRAQAVYDIMVAAGISGDRLNIIGNGVDSSVDKDNSSARQLVRRVTFRLK